MIILTLKRNLKFA